MNYPNMEGVWNHYLQGRNIIGTFKKNQIKFSPFSTFIILDFEKSQCVSTKITQIFPENILVGGGLFRFPGILEGGAMC